MLTEVLYSDGMIAVERDLVTYKVEISINDEYYFEVERLSDLIAALRVQGISFSGSSGETPLTS